MDQRSKQPTDTRVKKLLRQQSALADFGTYAFREENLQAILEEAARVCADSLGVRYCKILRHRREENDLIVQAGLGWKEDVVGRSISEASVSSPGGRAYVTRQPVITEDLRKPHDFILPPIYPDHGIVSTVNVVIPTPGDESYGVLEIDSSVRRRFDKFDINFLTGFANVLAEAVATVSRLDRLRAALAEKDAALAEKDVLSLELQHRVRNSLQVVWQLLHRQGAQSTSEDAKRGFEAVARRVMTIGQVYDHLLGVGMSRTVNFDHYLTSLCDAVTNFQWDEDRHIEVHCDVMPLPLDLDRTTALGIIVNELVTNSFDHAFPDDSGKVTVSLRHQPETHEATLVIRDDGVGFIDDENSKRFGIGLVRRLVEQLHGTLEMRSDNGTMWTITVPV